MSGRSVPHAHPATAEYEFANPSRLGEQRFGEGFFLLKLEAQVHGFIKRRFKS
ncbi:HSPB2-C11orf52 readthrough (NMD candidate) [Homo sapiens]|uniref:HSPB2-C11orf52 readthrough (NMD candidate) n=2 Tax=Hominidae TaxID=9604 RepID=E9PN16_HUMAN|nr:HSPB2-C11orf52 readthrough (NMD candidate) [Homo sapiens]KAI4074104.1 HSPB2-C11orf52 readthrough (NMD candidate) [Homo sapiens]PNJ76030.1 HSPB2-C11orf52 isoform 1 [Pongo abelii]